MNNPVSTRILTTKVLRVLFVFMALGVAVFVLGLFFSPERIWPNFLINMFYLTGVGLGSMFFIAALYVTNAGWATAFRRIPEALTSLLMYGAIGILPLAFGLHTLYEWTHTSVVLEDAILLAKSSWLNEYFFIGRLIFYFAAWILFSRKLVNNSLREDDAPDEGILKNSIRTSAQTLVFGGALFLLACFDLLMSLQPHWYSTVYGLQTLSGVLLNTLAVIALVLIILRKAGCRNLYTLEHQSTLGSLMLAFSAFWVYLWVSQHLLIWYSNIPEETSYYVFRSRLGWDSLGVLNLIMNWALPFVLLLPGFTKRNEKVMVVISLILVAGHWLDLFIMVMPTIHGATPSVTGWEVFPFLGMCSFAFWRVLTTLSKWNLVPVNDPYLVESNPHPVMAADPKSFT